MQCHSLSISISTFSTFGCNGLYHGTFFFLSAVTQILSLTPEAVPVKLET